MTPVAEPVMESAHDLRNQLQIVGSAVRLIARNLDPSDGDRLRAYIDGALISVDRASTLSQRILDRSRDDGAAEVVQLHLVLAALRDVVLLAAGPSIAVAFIRAEEVPAVVCHRRDLENVILNLVANARDAMDGVGRLTLSIACDGDAALLRVTDTGCGMNPEVARRALTPFFTTKRDGGGTGLGLAMADEFARRAGGSIRIESVPGKGTSVILRLPAAQ
jgi:signal transduction histidine kinase